MPTQLQVYNAAMDLLGERSIDSLADTGASALVLNRQWDFALTEMLRAYPWNWAKKREDLEEVSPVPSTGWAHRYTMPADYVTGLTVNEADINDYSDFFEIEGPYLLTDEDTVNLEYIAKPNDESSGDENYTTEAYLGRMDPLAVNCLITLLAAKCATKLARDGLGLQDALMNRYYNNDLVKARYRNICERAVPAISPPARSSWITSRLNSTNG